VVRLTRFELKEIARFLQDSVSADHGVLSTCFQATFQDELAKDSDTDQLLISHRMDTPVLIRAARISGHHVVASTTFLPPDHPQAVTSFQLGPAVEFDANTRADIPFQATNYPPIEHDDIPLAYLSQHVEGRLFALQNLMPHDPAMSPQEYSAIMQMFRHRGPNPNLRFTPPTLSDLMEYNLRVNHEEYQQYLQNKPDLLSEEGLPPPQMTILAAKIKLQPQVLAPLAEPFEKSANGKFPHALHATLIHKWLTSLVTKINKHKLVQDRPGTTYECEYSNSMIQLLEGSKVPDPFLRTLGPTNMQDHLKMYPFYTDRQAYWGLVVLDYALHIARFYYTKRDAQDRFHARRASRLQKVLEENSETPWRVTNEAGLDMGTVRSGAAASGPMMLYMAACIMTRRKMSLYSMSAGDIQRIRAWVMAVLSRDFELNGLLPPEWGVASETQEE